MALVAFGPVLFPTPLSFNGITPAFRAILLDATAEKLAVITHAPQTGTLDGFELLLGTVGQAPASGLRFSFQDVSLTTGDPDGTADQFRTVTAGITSDTWLVSGLVTDDGSDTGVKRIVTQGDRLACVVEFASWDTGDSVNFNMLDVSGNNVFNTPENYVAHYIPISWTQPNCVLGIALKYE
jgi:hypothetical protein